METEKNSKILNKEKLEKIREKITTSLENKDFKKEVVKRVIHDKKEIRDCFLAVVRTSPARFGDIDEKLFCGRQSTYRHLYKLIELGLVKKIAIMSLWNKKNLNEEQKEIMKKFNEWTKAMKEGMKQYFGAKTNYFVLTESALKEDLLDWVVKCELEMKGGELTN